jgi:hypothetical protein
MRITLSNMFYPPNGEINPVYRFFLILILLFVGALGISLLFPMFFRTDDALQIDWISRIRFADLFNAELNIRENSIMKGTYRPFASLFFMVCYRLFGMNPFGYQVFYTMIFLFNFYLLYYLCKIYFNSGTGLIVLLVYCGLFYNHFQLAFWFSNITTTLHLVFSFLSIIFYIKGKDNLKSILLSYLFAFGGAFTKEPAILIISAFVFADFIVHTRKQDYLRRIWILIPYLGIGLWLWLISPTIDTRFGKFSDAAVSLAGLDFRFKYYFDFLLSGSRNIIPLLLGVLYALSLFRSIWVKLILIVLSIPCYFNTYYFAVFLFLFSFLFVIQEKKLFPLFCWMLVTSLSLPFIRGITPSYLFEFSFGLSILLGLIIYKYLYEKYFLKFYAKHRKVSIIVLTILLLFGSGVAIKPVGNQVKALQLIVETRKNLAEGIGFIEENKERIKCVVVPDKGLHDSKETLARKALQSNTEKARNKRTMEWNDLGIYLPLIHCHDIKVVPLSRFNLSAPIDKSVILLLQNDADIDLASEKGLMGDTLFSYSHFNSNNLVICHFR